MFHYNIFIKFASLRIDWLKDFYKQNKYKNYRYGILNETYQMFEYNLFLFAGLRVDGLKLYIIISC
jgi:hypothetical protein